MVSQPSSTDPIQQTLSGLHPLEMKVLLLIREKRQDQYSDESLRKGTGLDDARLSMALGWLLTKQILKTDRADVMTHVSLTDLGQQYLGEGFPAIRVVERLKSKETVFISGLRNELDGSEVSKAIGELKEAGVIRIQAGGLLEALQGGTAGSSIAAKYEALRHLAGQALQSGMFLEHMGEQERKLILEQASSRGKKGVFHLHEKKNRFYSLTDFGKKIVQAIDPAMADREEITQLKPEHLMDGSWRNKTFRRYNIGLSPKRISVGRKHPYREFLDQVKFKLVGMGFREMRGGIIESEFWNSDALFMPQFHPARAIHDVYFVKEPQQSDDLPGAVLERVQKTHENGWKTGSTGWRYAFDPQRARRLVLRSQGTAVSARTLASGPLIPGKYFSIARCFRYDRVDATHAPDFYQIEGIVLGQGIHFRTLLGLLQLFATEMAKAAEIKFLPAYFPYTEPSVELHAKHPQLGWIELGGAGLFRPEVTIPLGVRVPVIAWGLGLDRMAMMALGIDDIRDLFSPDLEFVRGKRLG